MFMQTVRTVKNFEFDGQNIPIESIVVSSVKITGIITSIEYTLEQYTSQGWQS